MKLRVVKKDKGRATPEERRGGFVLTVRRSVVVRAVVGSFIGRHPQNGMVPWEGGGLVGRGRADEDAEDGLPSLPTQPNVMQRVIPAKQPVTPSDNVSLFQSCQLEAG